MEQGEDQSVSVSFHVGSAPPSYKNSYEPYLFNTQGYREQLPLSGWQEFHLLNKQAKRVLASATFYINNGVAKSPVRAPFGGFDYNNDISLDTLFNFITDVERALLKIGVREIDIVCPSELYSTAQPFITISLLNQGYTITLAEPGACIKVDKTPLTEKMTKDKRARLRQCERARLSFRKIDLKKIETIYSFIAACRSKQGRQLSMTLPDLRKTIQALPKSFFLVGVFDEAKMIGACICVRVTSKIIYTFYSAHDEAYDKISPRVFLLSNLYKLCQKNKVNLLDLGTSALEGKPNFTLLDFKLRIGATLTPKFKFRKLLA